MRSSRGAAAGAAAVAVVEEEARLRVFIAGLASVARSGVGSLRKVATGRWGRIRLRIDARTRYGRTELCAALLRHVAAVADRKRSDACSTRTRKRRTVIRRSARNAEIGALLTVGVRVVAWLVESRQRRARPQTAVTRAFTEQVSDAFERCPTTITSRRNRALDRSYASRVDRATLSAIRGRAVPTSLEIHALRSLRGIEHECRRKNPAVLAKISANAIGTKTRAGYVDALVTLEPC